MKGILVFIELKDTYVRKVSYEALQAGKRIREAFSSKLYATLVGSSVAHHSEELKNHVDYLIVIEDENLKEFSPDAYAEVLHFLIQKFEISCVLGSHTGYGRFVLPKLAGMLDWPVLSDVTGLQIEDGKLILKKPIFGGRVLSYIGVEDKSPVVLSFRPNSFEKSEPDLSGEIIREKVEIKKDSRIRLLGSEKKEEKKVDLQEADFIICGGRGMKSPENFKILEEIAEIMGGRVGASRSVVDAKWRDYEEQIGKSGKTVSPLIYIGCGVSGAIHHTMGIDTSKIIVAINLDPNAPIFSIADYGIVDDLFTILPILKEELKKIKEEA